MAVLKMQRISICALKKDRKAILEKLQSLGTLEVDHILDEDFIGWIPRERSRDLRRHLHPWIRRWISLSDMLLRKNPCSQPLRGRN